MSENGYFAGEAENGKWEVFEVGRKCAICATEAEAIAETDRLSLLEADRLDARARAYEADADQADDFGEHVGVVNSVRRRARELRDKAAWLRSGIDLATRTPNQEGGSNATD